MGELKKSVLEKYGSLFTINKTVKKNVINNAQSLNNITTIANNETLLTNEDFSTLVAENGEDNLSRITSSIMNKDRQACINGASYDRIVSTSDEELYDENIKNRIRKAF